MRTKGRTLRSRSITARRLLPLLIAAIPLSLASCKTVEFYEKEHLNDPAMKFDDDPTEVHFVQKCAYSREGSVGGIGTGAGGGCGCY